MHTGLLGRKLGMTTVFSPSGEQVPVTVLEVGPCVVTQIKTDANDGYNAIQVGFLDKKVARTKKPLLGHFKKSGGRAFRFVREFAVDDPASYALGQTMTLDDTFKIGQSVEVSGVSKGRGFSGVVRRWGFKGGAESHGSMFHRAPGSIGSSAYPSRVIKGRKMPGHLGCRRTTVKGLTVVDIRSSQNVLLVKGAVPGSNRGVVEVRRSKATL